MFCTLSRALFLASLFVSAGAAAQAGEDTTDWPQFLGPRRDGIAHAANLNVDWEKSPPKVLWKVPLGSGYSSLAIVGDRLFTMTQRGTRDVVVCLDAHKGTELWAHDATPTYTDKQKQGRGPRGTPTHVQGRLYCLLPQGELLCVQAADGKEIWRTNIFEATGAVDLAGEFYYWGVSQSPLVEGDQVIVQPGGSKDNSVAAFHKDTGKLLWSSGSDPIGYASPILITVANRRLLVCPTGRSILGLDPEQGQVRWRYEFGNKFNATGATPVWTGELLFVSAAYGVGSAALEIVCDNDRWSVREKWRKKKELQNVFATSMVIDGHVYGCHGDLGAFLLRCLDLKTGAVKWEQRQERRSSLLAIDGYLLNLDERGHLALLKATPDRYEVKGELRNLLSYKSWAAPAFSRGRLYLRDERHVLCLDLRRP
jgi:outer membrane protein assembly factor BamB